MIKTQIAFKILFIISTLLYPTFTWGQLHNSEIIDAKRNYQLKGDKLLLSGITTIQVNNRMGDNDASIYIYYSKGDKVKINEAWIQDMSGNVIRKLKKREISDVSAVDYSTLYSDRFIKKFKLIHNEHPYQIVYSYDYERNGYTVIENLNYQGRLQPIRNMEIIVETPIDNPIKYIQDEINEPIMENLGNGKKYSWKFSYNPPAKNETMADLNSLKVPHLMILPETFKYGAKGSYNSWKALGEWIRELNEGRDVLPDSEKKIIDNLVKGVESAKEKVRILYHYMQDNTRYVNVSIKIGGLQTYPAEYVCINRYGDCKALTNYMQSMLKYVGVKSYYTIIDAGVRVNDFDINFPQNAFNHVILTIPFEKDTTYLECTSQNLAFGYINTSIQGRIALLIDSNNSQLITIPSQLVEDVKTSRVFDINLQNTSQIICRISATLRGYNYELYKEIQRGINKNVADQYIHNNILNASYHIDNYEFISSDRDSVYIGLQADLTVRNIVKKYGNNLAITPFSWNLPSWELPDSRKQNIQIDYPIYKEDEITYRVPNSKVVKVPEDINLVTSYGEYIVKYAIVNEHKVKVSKSMKIYAGRYAVSQYQEFYQFMSQIMNNENKNFYLEIL